MTLDDLRILKFPCPQCGAKSGEKCKTKSGKRLTTGFHIHRKGKVYPDMVNKPRRGLPKIKKE